MLSIIAFTIEIFFDLKINKLEAKLVNIQFPN